MKEVSKTIDLIDGLGGLRVSVSENGETLKSTKADSYLGSFVTLLHKLTALDESFVSENPKVWARPTQLTHKEMLYEVGKKSVSEYADPVDCIRFQYVNDFKDSFEYNSVQRKVYVHSSPELSNSATSYMYNVYYNGDYIWLIDPSDGEFVPLPSGDPQTGSFYITLFEESKQRDSSVFRNPSIKVGTSTTANSIEMRRLQSPFFDGEGPISYGSPTVEPPVASTDKTTMVLKQTISNTSSSDVTIDEIGVFCRPGGEPQTTYDNNSNSLRALFIRDLFNHTIPANTQQQFEYKFQTPLQTTSPYQSGLLRQFLELLYRQMSNSDRTIKDIYNADKVSNSLPNQLYLNETGGKNRGEWIGPQIGISDFQVSTSNPSLIFDQDPGFELPDSENNPAGYFGSRIPHGDETNKVEHLGTLVKDVAISGSSASFKISKVFYNDNGGAIDIKEVGLNASPKSSGSHCIYRQVLASPFTFNQGDFVKLSFVIEISV